MSVQNLVLFVSSNSKECVDPMRFITHYRMPINVVRLDSAYDRQRAAPGKFFQIHSVPTLVVIYQDGNTQLFVGKEKILTWLQNLVNRQSPEQRLPEQRPSSQSTSTPTYAEDSAYPTTKSILQKRKKGKKGKKKVTFEEEETDGEITPVELEFEDVPQKPRTTGFLVGAHAKKADTGMNDIMKEAARMQEAMKATVVDYKGD